MTYERRFNRCERFTDLKTAYKSALHNDMKYQHGADLNEIYTAFVETCHNKGWIDLWRDSKLPQTMELVREYVEKRC